MLARFSDGAGWPISVVLHHANLFGSVAAFAFGWAPAATAIDDPHRPKLFLAAGTLEPGFYQTTVSTARPAQTTGQETDLKPTHQAIP